MSGESDGGLPAGVALDDDAPADWQPIDEMPLVVVVGVTGVGKSATIERLAQRMRCFVLPDRRDVADLIVIPTVQDELGLPRRPVRDRVERFRLVARYREKNPGGIAHALTRLRIDPAVLGGCLVFDGLRGTDEIEWAIAHLPRTRFLGLRAPESVRLLRLLGRDQPFDFVEGSSAAAGESSRDVETLLAAVPGLDEVVPAPELAALLRAPALEGVALDEIARKATILVEEAKNYDPAATLRLLESELGPWRHLIVNTAVHAPDEVADQAARWLQ